MAGEFSSMFSFVLFFSRPLQRQRKKVWNLFFTDSGTRGRCYDKNFLRVSTIFREKIGDFLKNQCYDQIFEQFSLESNTANFSPYFRRKNLKSHNIWSPCFHSKSAANTFARRSWHWLCSGSEPSHVESAFCQGLSANKGHSKEIMYTNRGDPMSLWKNRPKYSPAQPIFVKIHS
jgi:hypothetical protein